MAEEAPPTDAPALPDGDLVRVLREQHARIRRLFDEVTRADGPAARKDAFDDLRALLAVHEAAEETVLRPLSRRCAGASVVDARNDEEGEATRLLQELEATDVTSAAFDARFADLEECVDAHARAEEREEFPAVVAATTADQRQRLGRLLTAVEALAPTHAHPAAAGSTAGQVALGPFAAMVDHARDAVDALADAAGAAVAESLGGLEGRSAGQ